MRYTLKWRLETTNWDDIRNGKYKGDRFLNTQVDCFFTLDDVWKHIGGRLKKQRFGYSGIKGNIEYTLTRVPA